MNASVFKGLSSFAVPAYHGDAVDSLAVNNWGDVFMLTEKGINYTSLVQKTTTSRELPLWGADLQLLTQMSNIKFNAFGTILLVWGASAAGVIVLPRTYTLYGDFEEHSSHNNKSCEFIAVLKPEDCRGQIMQVRWHPYHAEYVVLLHQKGPIEMRNVFTGIATAASLSQSVQYSSFTFGPAIGWLAVSVLILGDNGNVYVVSPMLPVGSMIPVEIVVQMADGIAYENQVMERVSSERAKLLKQANLYLSAAFGDLSGEYRTNSDMICVGGPFADLEKVDTTGPNLSYHQRLMLEALRCPPAMQGVISDISDFTATNTHPVNKRQTIKNHERGSSRDNADIISGGHVDSAGPKKRGAGVRSCSAACDIVVLPASSSERRGDNEWTSADAAPVIVIVWKDGTSKICVLSGQVCPHWDDVACSKDYELLHEALGSSDTPILSENGLLHSLPNMVTVEWRESPIASSWDTSASPQLWRLHPDPVLRHCYHMIAHGTGAVYMISVRWLADTLFEMQTAVNCVDGSRTKISDSVLIGDMNVEVAPATLIPLFPTASFNSSISSGHPLSAFVVIHNPTYGHIALFQTRSPSGPTSSISSVNLTVLLASIAQEHRLANKMQNTVYNSGDTSRALSNLSIDRDDALHRSASRILRQSEQALQDCQLQVRQHEADRLAKVDPPSVDLSKTWIQLDNEVVMPLEELQQRISLSVDIVRDVYEAQVEILQGSEASPSSGLINQLANIRTKQAAIDERMKAIATALEDQISVCASIMAFFSYKARELTTGEREFKAELDRCESLVSRLDAAIQSLESIQIQRTRVARDSRNVLSPPSGMQERFYQANKPGSPSVSPYGTREHRAPSTDDETLDIQTAFMSMGLKSKKNKASDISKYEGLTLKRSFNPKEDGGSSLISPDQKPSSFGNPSSNGAFHTHNGEFNVYSTHTPFVTPLRAKAGEEFGRSGKLNSFVSPMAPASGGRGSHWTVHNFSSTTPHKVASKWAANRTGGASRVSSKSVFRQSHKRYSELEPEEISDEPSRKHNENIGVGSSGTPLRASLDSAIDAELLDKLGKEGSDIEYLCKQVSDVEKRIAELANIALTLPSVS